MKNRKVSFLLRLTVTICVGVFVAGPSVAQTLETLFPRGSWSLGARPYMNAGYETLPVRVYSVTSNLNNGGAVTKAGIENRTSQSLTALKLSWYLSTTQNPEVVLRQGQTRMLNLPESIGAGESRVIVLPIVTFARAYGALVRNGSLNGDYLIQVAVSEAVFEDGSTQVLLSANGRVRPVRFANAAFRALATQQNPPYCPNQGCDVVRRDTTGPVIGYQCSSPNSSLGERCTNTSATSCTRSICGGGGGGGNPPQPELPVNP